MSIARIELSNEERAAAIIRMAPRLFRVSGAAFQTFSLLDGVSRKLNENLSANDFMAVADAYRQACAELIVVQLNALLDRNEKRVSFQAVYRYLNEEVAELLVAYASDKMPEATWFPERCRKDLIKFQDAYHQIDWVDLHGRLKHFRDHAIAHIFEERYKKTINYGEVRTLVIAVSRMTEGIGFLNRPHGVSDETTIEYWTMRTKEAWDAAFRMAPSDEQRNNS